MKNFLLVLMVVAFSAVVTTEANSATYIVRNNDTLTKISGLTGHSVFELMAMNDIVDPNLIQVGQQITFLSQDDLMNAEQWCQYMTRQSDAINVRFFRESIEDLRNRDIRYSVAEPKGLHYEVVLAFAKAWEEFYKN
jgi:hypothetical protein